MFAGVGVIAILSIIIGIDISKVAVATEEYSLFVDPIKDEQNLFVTGRVTIQNTGTKPITNLRVNFGEGDVEEMATLKPGQKIILSPPSDNSMDLVIVSADNGIYVDKVYRTPPKMVGMMGS